MVFLGCFFRVFSLVLAGWVARRGASPAPGIEMESSYEDCLRGCGVEAWRLSGAERAMACFLLESHRKIGR
jgi:hypothetical protein